MQEFLLDDFSKICHSTIEVRSGYNDKVLTRNYNSKKHSENLGKRKVISIWSEVRTSKSGYSQFISPTICVYVDGSNELLKDTCKRIGNNYWNE